MSRSDAIFVFYTVLCSTIILLKHQIFTKALWRTRFFSKLWYNEPLHNEVLNIAKDFLHPSNSKICEKETSIQVTKPRYSEQILSVRYNKVPLCLYQGETVSSRSSSRVKFIRKILNHKNLFHISYSTNPITGWEIFLLIEDREH